MWSYTVLEIYQPQAMTNDGEIDGLHPWPAEGTPADWIDMGLVGYCQGEARDLVALTPFWKLIWWKVTDWADRFREWADWRCQRFAANIWDGGE